MGNFVRTLFDCITGNVRIPKDVAPVTDFSAERYLGKWYEIARFDHFFERGLSNVTAEYSLRADGSIKVMNRGFSNRTGSWKEAQGKAYFVKDPTCGFLKVSFFGPVYGSYIVLELDQERYQYSLVCGPDRSYLWILARTPILDETVKERLLAKAATLEFDVSRLIFVVHDTK